MKDNFLARSLISCGALLSFVIFFQNCSPPAASTAKNDATNGATDTTFPMQLKISSIPAAHGIFDASLAVDPNTQKIWMSYSAINASVLWPSQNIDVVTTRLASSSDQGVTWTDAGLILNNSLDVTIGLPAPNNAGTWHNEVSSLTYDPGAPSNQRWKLVWHHYLLLNGARMFEHGWIAMKMAATPVGLATATELKLFSASIYDVSNNIQGGGSGSPLGGAPAIALDTAFSANLNGCAVFTEPGLMATNSSLYLSLLCGKSSTDHRIILLKCASPCNPGSAASWSYIGTLLSEPDAIPFGFNQGFSAANLVSANGINYLIVTPQSTTPFDGYYNGCKVFKFTNIDTGTLQKTSGTPDVIASAGAGAGSFSGACTYLPELSKNGIIYSHLFSSEVEKFRLFYSGVKF